MAACLRGRLACRARVVGSSAIGLICGVATQHAGRAGPGGGPASAASRQTGMVGFAVGYAQSDLM